MQFSPGLTRGNIEGWEGQEEEDPEKEPVDNTEQFNKRLELAQETDEKIFEIPVTISRTIKVPRNILLSYEKDKKPGDDLIDTQYADIDYFIQQKIHEVIDQQDPEIFEIAKEKLKLETELYNMTQVNRKTHEFPIEIDSYLKSEGLYNPERAKEIVRRFKEIEAKYELPPSKNLEDRITVFKNLGDKID